MTPTLNIFKCLGDMTRLRCMVLLHKESTLCVCELTTALALSQPKISRHLALLRQNQLLLDSREGQWVYYRINPDLPTWLLGVLDNLLDEAPIQKTLKEDITRLQHMESYPMIGKANKCCN